MRSAGRLLVAPLVVAVVVAVVALAACGGREPVYAWRDGAAANVELRVREELLPHRVAREVRVNADGRVESGSTLVLTIGAVRHERWRDGRPWGDPVTTESAGASPEHRAGEDAALARVGDALVGRRFRMVFDPAAGLTAVDGLGDALAASAPAGDTDAEDARDGLVSLLSDGAVLRGVRAAGLVGTPADFADRSSSFELRADVFLPGRGVAACRLLGSAGFENDGSPVVRRSGRLRSDAPAKGDPGPAPPDDVGPVLTGDVEAESETLHDPVAHVPLRGRCTVRVPFARGATVVTTTSFALSVRP